MQTFLLFGIIILAVVLMVLAISKLKMHPFIVMVVIGVSFLSQRRCPRRRG